MNTHNIHHVCFCGEVRKISIIYGLEKRLILSYYVLVAHANITKTCLYNFDPRKPHFYAVKLGFTGVYVIFLISAQNIDCG